MSGSEKDRLAAMVIAQHCAFQQALAGSRQGLVIGMSDNHEDVSFIALIGRQLGRRLFDFPGSRKGNGEQGEERKNKGPTSHRTASLRGSPLTQEMARSEERRVGKGGSGR